MSVDPDEFSVLMALVAQGDQQAADQLFHFYEDSVLTMLRSRLNHGRFRCLHSLLDEDDLSQNIWADLFANAAKCRDFATPANFLKYLTGMVHHQVAKAARTHLDTQKRDLRHMHHLSDPAVTDESGTVADPHSTPFQHAAFRDDWNRLVSSLPARAQQVVLMLRDGFSHREIAAKFALSERSIERIIISVREKPTPENIPNW